MEKRRGSWLAHGTNKFFSRIFQPDDHIMRDLFLNLMAIVGLIFLAVILLHLIHGVENKYSFFVYVAIFLFLEFTVISFKLYIYLRRKIRKHPPTIDAENVVRSAIKNCAVNEAQLVFAVSGDSQKESKLSYQKRNSF